jgi:hypothetical protein
MRASKTHFEQIPVETVKKIAKEFRETSADQVLHDPEERWRLVAEQVHQEQDPKRLTELVEQLLEEFDGKDLRKGPVRSGRKRLQRSLV